MTLGKGAKKWPYKSNSEHELASALSIYSTLIAIVLRGYNVLFCAIVEFH